MDRKVLVYELIMIRRSLFMICKHNIHLSLFPSSGVAKASLSLSLLTDTNVIRYIQLTEMKLSRCSQREKEAM